MKLEDAKELQIYLKQIWTKYQKEDLNQKSKMCIRKYEIPLQITASYY